MATTTLSFTEKQGIWEAKFTSQGNTIIELEREENGVVSVLANISGMRPVAVGQYQNGYGVDAIIRVNVPSGLEVTIKSQSEVKNAKMFVEE